MAFPRSPRSSCIRTAFVVSWNGDGCFLMNGRSSHAVQYGADVVFVVIDNGMYGTIRMHQERRYPDRVVGSSLSNPDFAALARAFGAHGETVRRTGSSRQPSSVRSMSGAGGTPRAAGPASADDEPTLDSIRTAGGFAAARLM